VEGNTSNIFIFRVFSPEIACQALKTPNSRPANNIRVTYELHSNRYTGHRAKKWPPNLVPNQHFRHNPFVMNILTRNPFIMKILQREASRKLQIRKQSVRYIGRGAPPSNSSVEES
jgi:hypothetical protein